MWQPQMAALLGGFRVVRLDHRGHGRTEVTAAPYTVDQLAEDAIGVLDALGIAEAHFVGCSLGGMIGQAIAVRWPQRLRSLVLVGSRSAMPPAGLWEERIGIARSSGIAPLLPTMLARWFTASFRESNPAAVEAIARGVLATPVEGFVGACMAIRDMDHSRVLSRIVAPTLVTSAEDDPGVPREDTLYIQRAIPGASAVFVKGARHLFSIERAEVFTPLLLDWLSRH